MNWIAHLQKRLYELPTRESWGLFIGWMAIVTALSALSGDKLPEVPQFRFGDKVLHFIAFLPGGWLACHCLKLTTPLRPVARFLLALAVVSLFGYLDELHQTLTPGRKGADWGDWLADTIGGAVGAAIYSRSAKGPATRS